MGIIFALKRFEIHDGDGVRTTLFLKGCPLRCKWCHNPEGISPRPQLSYLSEKCIGCGECAAVCPLHTVNGDGHRFDRTRCVGCGRCEAVCLGGALRQYGREVTAEEILPALLEDRDFYRYSGGGVTLSGGEPLLQAVFCAELLERLKAEGINTAVDTCGLVAKEQLALVIPYTDTFLFDLKAMDEAVHIRCTGASNRLILKNLQELDHLGKAIEIRIPYVPGLNDGEMEAIGRFLSGLHSVRKIKLLPYHDYAVSKYRSLGLAEPLPGCHPPRREEIDRVVAAFEHLGLPAVNGARE